MNWEEKIYQDDRHLQEIKREVEKLVSDFRLELAEHKYNSLKEIESIKRAVQKSVFDNIQRIAELEYSVGLTMNDIKHFEEMLISNQELFQERAFSKMMLFVESKKNELDNQEHGIIAKQQESKLQTLEDRIALRDESDRFRLSLQTELQNHEKRLEEIHKKAEVYDREMQYMSVERQRHYNFGMERSYQKLYQDSVEKGVEPKQLKEIDNKIQMYRKRQSDLWNSH